MNPKKLVKGRVYYSVGQELDDAKMCFGEWLKYAGYDRIQKDFPYKFYHSFNGEKVSPARITANEEHVRHYLYDKPSPLVLLKYPLWEKL